VELLDEPRVGPLAVLPFRVHLRTRPAPSSMTHSCYLLDSITFVLERSSVPGTPVQQVRGWIAPAGKFEAVRENGAGSCGLLGSYVTKGVRLAGRGALSRRLSMPIRIRVDPAARVRYAVIEGTVGDDELIDAYAAVLGDPDFDPTLNDLVDARTVRRIDVTPMGLRRLADLVQQIDRLALPTKVAVVTPDDVAYDAARMYEALRAGQRAPAEHRVFRDMEEARRWLGLEPE
jgi:hypothetical protein